MLAHTTKLLLIQAAKGLAADHPGVFVHSLTDLAERMPQGLVFGVQGAGSDGRLRIDFEAVPGFVVIAPVH